MSDMLNKILESKRKWFDIAFNGGVDLGGENCELCKEYVFCNGCPIREYTGRKRCSGTPINEWVEHHFKEHKEHIDFNEPSVKVLCDECKEIAIKEWKFLDEVYRKNIKLITYDE